MKRQKRILAGAAVMLLALGMLIGCDTPANSGSTGGDITLPAGDSAAESKLEGTWVREGEDPEVYVFKEDGTCKNGNDEGTWSATDTELSIKYTMPADYFDEAPPVTIELTSDGKLSIMEMGLTCSRTSGPEDSVEGTWELHEKDETSGDEQIVQITIKKDSFEIISTAKTTSLKRDMKITGSRENNTLTEKAGEDLLTVPYKLDGNTLTFNGTTYTRQQ